MGKRYRQAYIRNYLEIRAKILRAIRSFFVELQFLEVETPIRIPTPTPEATIDAQESGEWFLHTSPELCMKRLVAAGYNRIFQLCKCFRKHERGAYHLPEMTLLEWYEAYSDYKKNMFRCEALLKYIAAKLEYRNEIYYRDKVIDLSGTWDRVTVAEAFKMYATTDVDSAIQSDRFDQIMNLEIEPNLGIKKPVFLYEYPAAMGSLARLSPYNLLVAERFELYCAGIELCNAFTELSDPVEQRKRFLLEQRRSVEYGNQINPMPEPFLEALSDMPLTAGNAMGVDRLVMLFSNAHTIEQVVTFIPEEL